MWYLLYLLPIFLWIVVSIRSVEIVNLSSAMSTLGLDIFTNNIIYTNLCSIFGANGILPLFNSPDILMFMSYFVSVFLIHLAIDFLLFIPRLADKWLNKLYGGD